MVYLYFGYFTGLEQFIADGVPSNKLVLGAPWYGFSYNCTTYNQVSDYI